MVTTTKSSRTNTPRKPALSNFAKKNAKPTNTILNFFQKAPKPEDSLFVGSVTTSTKQEEGIYAHEDESRYNESESPNKKRRLSNDINPPSLEAPEKTEQLTAGVEAKRKDEEPAPKAKPRAAKTPFLMESDSEDDEEEDAREGKLKSTSDPSPTVLSDVLADKEKEKNPIVETAPASEDEVKYETPQLEHQNSTDAQFDQLGDFADLEDADLGEYEGEEMREMRFMREQARLEAAEIDGLSTDDIMEDIPDHQAGIDNCPICNGSLVSISIDEATRHVNGCLDGNPIPLPKQEATQQVTMGDDIEPSEMSKRFARAAIPRPGQANPFQITSNEMGPKSAFSKLMSGNAEDSAWATAAAAENASRGRPAHERTCPFYKIIPGFSICVDAFRYGAVEGCKAYFLSHFHSDHYIGLTANWRHGPIYCSKVTGNLVKQQLRTAAKWVVELEFEKSYDIPGTDGATVTMIPANHCPGSSLFLFEKPFQTGPNKRKKRILHCGDFRACPAHVRHPLLKPDVLDSVSGKWRQQKIDLCYLDTTYLNPRYSFPPQGDVIQACADLVASMSPNPNCNNDLWRKTENTAGIGSVSKYFQNEKGAGETTLAGSNGKTKNRLLVICGTYSIGKERICVALAKALKSKIFASAAKIKLCKQLDDPELTSLLTSNPVEAQVHMQMLMEIRAETLQEYLDSYRPHFSRIIGFRPSGWNFRPKNGKSIAPNTSPGSIAIQQILHGPGWRTRFGAKDFIAQRGSTKEAMCFGVPYSEHSSFRELALFVMSLRIEKVIPTVNIGSEQSRKRMKGWIDKWMLERRKGDLVQPLVEGEVDEIKSPAWEGKAGAGGYVMW